MSTIKLTHAHNHCYHPCAVNWLKFSPPAQDGLSLRFWMKGQRIVSSAFETIGMLVDCVRKPMTAEIRPFKGMVVLITGAAQGLGKATALAFSSRGAAVALVDMNESLLNETANEL